MGKIGIFPIFPSINILKALFVYDFFYQTKKKKLSKN